MKIISWNVNGIRSVYKKGFHDWIDREDPDILCLQEIKSQEIPVISDLFSKDYLSKYKVHINFAQKKGYSGVAVFSKEKPMQVLNELGIERFDKEGRFLLLKFDKFNLINIYIPHGARDKSNLGYKLVVYEKLTNYLSALSQRKFILCGDFNVAHEEIDLANPKTNKHNIMFTGEERDALNRLIDVGLIDSFRYFHKDGENYSWWPYRVGLRERNVGWRIDYIFISKNLQGYLKEAFISREVLGSDHCPVGIQIDL